MKFILAFSYVAAQIFGCLAFAADPGVMDTEVIIGAHTNETGARGDKFPIGLAYFFEDVNEKGGVNGRKIKFIREDIGVVTSRAVESTRKLVEQDKIFAMVGAGPSFAHQAVWKYLVDKGVPDLFFNDGAKLYQDPFQRTVFPSIGQFFEDGYAGASFVAHSLKSTKACFLIVNSESDLQYAAGAQAAIDEFNKQVKTGDSRGKIAIGPIEKIDRNASSANSEVLKLKRANCDVVFNSIFGAVFPQSVNFAFEQGFKPQWVTYNFNSKRQYLELMKEGIREGFIATQFAQREPFSSDDPSWKKVEEFAKKHNMVESISTIPFIMYVGETFVEALNRAGRDLTREKLIAAAESLKGFKCTTCLQPLELSSTNHWPWRRPKVSVWKGAKWVLVD